MEPTLKTDDVGLVSYQTEVDEAEALVKIKSKKLEADKT